MYPFRDFRGETCPNKVPVTTIGHDKAARDAGEGEGVSELQRKETYHKIIYAPRVAK